MDAIDVDRFKCGDCGRKLFANQFSLSNWAIQQGGGRRVARCKACEARRERRRALDEPRHSARGRREARALAAAVWRRIFAEDLPPCWIVHADRDDRNNDLDNLIVVLDGAWSDGGAAGRARRLGPVRDDCCHCPDFTVCQTLHVDGAIALHRIAELK